MRPNRVLATALLCLGAAGSAAEASAPDLVSFQGRLTSGTGQPLTGPVTLRFRIRLGGDASTVPSTGSLTYHERAIVTPGAGGVFSHMIGSGTPQADCAGGPCVLGPTSFGEGSLPAWIEVTIDPDGIVGTSDDDLLLPRTRLGTTAFAYRVDSLDGAVLGSGRSLGLAPLSGPAPGANLRFNHLPGIGADGDADGQPDPTHGLSFCYNCAEGSTGLEVGSEYGLAHAWGLTEAPQAGVRTASESWTLLRAGQPPFQPFHFDLDTDWLGGSTNPSAEWTFRTSRATVGLLVERSGDVQLGGDLRLAPGQALRFGADAALLDDQATDRLVIAGGHDELQLGPGLTDFALLFDPTSLPPARMRWDSVGRGFRFSHEGHFDEGITVPPSRAITFGPFANPVPNTYVRLRTTTSPFSDGNLDGIPDEDIVSGLCYNCREFTSSVPEVPGEYSMKAQWEWTYAPQPGQRLVEHNWDFLSTTHAPYRPYGFYLDVDQAGGHADPRAQWTLMPNRSVVALHINQNGNVMIGGDTPQPAHRLEVLGAIRATDDLKLGAQKAVRFAERAALADDTASDRLQLGGTWGEVELHAGGQSRVEIDAARVKLADASGSAGTSLVLGSCANVTAASIVTLGACNVASFTGSSMVERLDPCTTSTAGRVLHVLCGASATRFCDGDGTRCSGGNLRLAGSNVDFTCTPDDVLTLLCDGARWRQIGLSAN